MKHLTRILSLGFIAIAMIACGKQNTVDQALLNQQQAGGYINPQTGQWVSTGTGQGGCVPLQSGNFSFTGSGVYMSQTSIYAGLLPQNSTYPGAHGTVVMGGAMNQGAGMIQYQPKNSANGMLQLSASSSGGMISGMIQLNQGVIQQIMINSGAYNNMGMNNSYNNSLCVQSMSFDIVQNVISAQPNYGYNTGYNQMAGYGQVIQALVYLTLSTGQTVGPIALQ